MTQYGTLRTWAAFLKLIGIVYVIVAIFGTISLAVDVEGVWKTIGVICIGIPVAIFLATLPIALAQMMRALADVGDAVRGS